MKLDQYQVQHLLLRSGFGDGFSLIHSYLGKSPEKILSQQFELASKSKPLTIDPDYVMPYGRKEMSTSQRMEMITLGKTEIKKLNSIWLKEMVSAKSGIREKMAFFWHDHFACKVPDPLLMQAYLEVIRGNSLGNFGDMLRDISKTPAMLQYLNNQQNRKKSPNENFAREVMELFTLGRDQDYTESDIREAARAFTGWGFNLEGEFVFRKFHHDEGVKEIFGESGNFGGDDVIEMLLKNKNTANYISHKWVEYFMNSEGDPVLEKKVADKFYRTNYDIKAALEVLFTDPIFYKKEHIGRRIKSPIELIVGMQRQLHMSIESSESLLYLQKMMGQMLFNPPNVAGWPDGSDWVDSATLMFRMNLPQLIFKAAVIQNYPGESFDDNDQFKVRGKLKQLETKLDMKALNQSFKDSDPSKLGKFLIQDPSSSLKGKGGELIDEIVHFTSKPEYQLC